MSTLFYVPCPECDRRLSLADTGGLSCRTCQQVYRLRLGHLFPEPPASGGPSGGRPGSRSGITTTLAAPASRPTSPARS